MAAARKKWNLASYNLPDLTFCRFATLVRHYGRWFQIDRMCALRDMEKLGVPMIAQWVESLRPPSRSKERAQPAPIFESDELHAFIVGYTSGGASYGVTWEEWDNLGPETGREEKNDLI